MALTIAASVMHRCLRCGAPTSLNVPRALHERMLGQIRLGLENGHVTLLSVTNSRAGIIEAAGRDERELENIARRKLSAVPDVGGGCGVGQRPVVPPAYRLPDRHVVKHRGNVARVRYADDPAARRALWRRRV